MDFYESALCAECTYNEIELLQEDKEFQYRIKQKQALTEYELLEKHNTALELAYLSGNVSPIQWRLSKLNPGKYNSKDKNVKLQSNGSVSIVLKGKKPNGSNT